MKKGRRCRPLLLLLLAAVLVAVAAWLLLTRRRGEGFLGLGKGSATIFVSVASFRDDECSRTLADMFAKARDPGRVFVGTCEQNSLGSADEGREACAPLDFEWAKNVRRIIVPHTEAGGPTVARYFCSLLYRNEDYFMQIDSHSEFVDGWDELVVAQQAALPDPATGVLTGYPRSREDDKAHAGVPVICKSKFDKNGIPTFESVIMDVKGRHYPVSFLAGGFIFAPGTFLRDVPFDDSLVGLFAGEEILLSARAWTAGYDFYAPTRNILYHYYTRKDSPKFWNLPNRRELQARQAESVRKVKALMTGALPGYGFGMGKKRTLAQYNAFAALDWDAKTSGSFEKFCLRRKSS